MAKDLKHGTDARVICFSYNSGVRRCKQVTLFINLHTDPSDYVQRSLSLDTNHSILGKIVLNCH